MFVLKYRKDYYRIDEVARLFGVHLNTVRYWADNHTLHCERTLGGHRRFPLDALVRAGASPTFS